MYKITDYSREQAQRLGVQIRPSTNKTKKIDVFKSGEKVASIGQRGAGDFPTYKEREGKAYADERRRLYKIRHQKFRNREGTPAFYADRILW